MKNFWFYLVWAHCAAVAVISVHFLLQLDRAPERPRNICSVAEISPDVTKEERERCRKIRGHKL